MFSAVITAFLTVSSLAQSQLVGDLNSDYTVNVRDLQAFAWEWLSPGCLVYECGGDLDNNDEVTLADFALLANNWQKVEARMVISEFMASNASNIPLEEGELLDGNGESSDWIEIYNPTDTSVNLDGWYLTNNDSNLTKWQFPNGLEVEPGEFLIVFASDKTFDLHPYNYPYLDPVGYYHTNFNLDKDEDYLALVAADGITVVHEYSPQFPDQLTDISYGLAQHTTAIVPKTAISSYHVPTSSDKNIDTAWTEIDFPDFSWNTQSTTNLHFGDICGGKGLNYEYFEGYWSYVPNFDYYTPIREGIVDNFDTTPRLRDDYFGFRFTGFIEVPLNGVYTFYTASDDGSLLFIGNDLVVYNDGTHVMEEMWGSIYLNAGMHPITVDYFEYNGNQGLIVSYEGPSISKREIPNEVLCSSTITNDMQDQMQYNNASLWTRIEFEVEDPHLFDMMVLQIRYEDGFAAYLNGQKVTWRNAPTSVKWDSTALSNRPIEDSSVYEQINLMAYLDLLLPKPQKNVLAIQGLNDNEINDEFRILPVLITAKNRVVPEYFTKPTPGTFNISGARGAVGDVWFSTERTFYNGPPDWHIDLTLSTATDGAEIRYTDDGSCPTITHGFIYDPATDPPLEIDKTTIIRAVAVKPGWLDSKVETHTYMFLNDIIQQPFRPTGFPTSGWGHDGPDYEMDPEVVIAHGSSIKEDLKAVPTLSLAMDVNDWFGSDGRGIYPQGELSERAVSAELILADGSEGFQIDCAVMIVGGSSVNRWKMDKLSMRLKFQAEYGPTELRYPLFGEEATDEFDTLVLDARMNNSWGYGGGVLVRGTRPWIFGRSVYQRDVAQYTRDQFVSDIQNAMGGYGAYGRHVHLYLNGLYWGLYWVHERPDEHFASSYFGGDDDEYDVLKHNSYTVLNGSNSNYLEMFSIANDGLPFDSQYQLIQQYLDVPNLIDYMITNFYVGNTDWDHHNWYATRSRIDPEDRWRYHSWDAEHVMENLYEDVTGRNNSGCPSRLHQRLSQNNEYKLLFADHAHRHLFNDGVLTHQSSVELYTIRLNEVDRAIVGESARWGDNQIDKYAYIRYMRDPHWLLERNWQLNTYLPNRRDILLDQLQSRNLYPPDTNAPVFYINGEYQHGGQVIASDELSMDNTNASGNIYYTLNGSDPRQALSGNAIGTKYTGPINLTKSNYVKARVLDGGTWSALNEAIFAIGPAKEDLRITEIMYHPRYTGNINDPNEEYIELKNIGTSTLNLNLVRFTEGIDFTFPDMDLDPGECVVVVKNQAAFQAQYGTSVNIAGQYTGSLANDGEGIKLVDAIGRTILDFEYKDGWRSITDGDGFSLTMIEPGDAAIYGSEEGLTAHWKLDDGTGGTAIDSVGTNHGTLNGDATWATGRFDGALSLDGDGDYVSLASIAELTGDTLTMQAWVRLSELAGVSNPILTQHVLSMTNDGYYFYVANDKPTFYLIDGFSSAQAISSETISRDQWVHIAGTNDGSSLKLYVNGKLKASASSTGLTGVINNAYLGHDTISSYYYYGLIDDVRIYNRAMSESEFQDIGDPLGRWSRKDSWRASVYRNGTPGWDDSDILPNPGAVVINEVMSHSNEGPDWIELHNTTDESINIGGWFLSDNNRDEPNMMKYRIANGTMINDNSYLVFYQDTDFNNPSDPGCLVPFALSENGEKACLSSHLDPNSMLTGYREVEDFGASATNVSLGRYFKSSTGNYNFVAMDSNTPGGGN
ncbi:MAG: lamin tail domain-containing protein, partial [Planctomycetota bacterium]